MDGVGGEKKPMWNVDVDVDVDVQEGR